jgi:peptidoglycan-N-acetylglucosamine deacetylase
MMPPLASSAIAAANSLASSAIAGGISSGGMSAVFAGVAAGAMTCGLVSWAAVAPSSQIFGPTIRRTGDPRTIALTFDDGPNPNVTPGLLELFARHKIRATFFLTGEHARALPVLTKEISGAGHTIGNHTFSHPALTFLSPRRIADELDRCDEAIASATGKKSRWMRPPFGFRGPQLNSVVRARGSAGVVMWSAIMGDWKPQPSEKMIRRLRRAGGGDIVLLHDGDYRVLDGDRRHTLLALEHWVPRWLDAGIRFVTIDDIHVTTKT